jgi:hypothetical protein
VSDLTDQLGAVVACLGDPPTSSIEAGPA